MGIPITKFAEYGLIGVIIAVLFFMLWRMLVWVMAFVKETIAQHTKEREAWLSSLKYNREITQEMAHSLKEHDKRADERGKYIREEHKQMIETLGRINGYNKE